MLFWNLLDRIETITKVSADYYKVIVDVKKNEFLLVALCNGWIMLDMGVM